MTDYVIEGNVDFYNKLYNSLDIEDDYNNDENLCLITNQPLTENFIKMECGHKFNYLPLFYDIKNHKQKFNGMEGSSSKLNLNQIRCPYCRKKQIGILPYYEEMELGKINGVNYISPNCKDKPTYYKYKYCEFMNLNPNYSAEGINPVESSFYNSDNCKFIKCSHTYALQINSGIINGENYGDEKYYCWSHKKEMIKKYKKQIIDKQKEDIKNEKLKKKEDIKNEKLKKKEDIKKIKEEKINYKLANNTKYIKNPNNNVIANDENIILGPSNVLDFIDINELCIEIVKSGMKKGLQCSCTKFKDNLCKRHFNLHNKNEGINK